MDHTLRRQAAGCGSSSHGSSACVVALLLLLCAAMALGCVEVGQACKDLGQDSTRLALWQCLAWHTSAQAHR